MHSGISGTRDREVDQRTVASTKSQVAFWFMQGQFMNCPCVREMKSDRGVTQGQFVNCPCVFGLIQRCLKKLNRGD